MIYTDGRIEEVDGCELSSRGQEGYWYVFEKWHRNGTQVRVRKLPCGQFSQQSLPGGEPVVWDGKNFRPSHR